MQDTGSVYGAEHATIDLARGLRARGAEAGVLLIVETRLGIVNSGLQAAMSAAEIPFATVSTDARFSLRLANEIAAALARERATVLHSIGYKSDAHGFFAARCAGIPQVSTVHGWLNRPDPKEKFYAWLNVRVFKRCARVIALSRFYETFLKSKGVSRAVYLPTGFAIPPFVAKIVTERTFTFGILGRLSWEKNHAMFLAAAAKLAAQNIASRFLIGGDGPERSAIESQISNLKLSIELPGYVETEKFFGQIDALVICSRIENQPYVVMEAMARGIPVIATNVGGLPDLVVDGVTGRLVPSDDAGALAGAMASFVREPENAARFGTAGCAKLGRDFSFDDWIARHLALYGTL